MVWIDVGCSDAKANQEAQRPAFEPHAGHDRASLADAGRVRSGRRLFGVPGVADCVLRPFSGTLNKAPNGGAGSRVDAFLGDEGPRLMPVDLPCFTAFLSPRSYRQPYRSSTGIGLPRRSASAI